MQEPTQNPPATVPEQPEAKPPVSKGMPVVIALIVIVALIGIANISSLLSGHKRTAPQSALPMRPTAANPQQVSSFETQQQAQARQDADLAQRQQQLAAAMQQLQAAQETPGPEAAGAPPMTAAQRDAMYGTSSNAPAHTSNVSEAQAEAKQKQLAREKQQQDAIAIEREQPGEEARPRCFRCRLEREHLDMALTNLEVIAVPCDRTLHYLTVHAGITAELVPLGPFFEVEEVAEKLKSLCLFEQPQSEGTTKMGLKDDRGLFKIG